MRRSVKAFKVIGLVVVSLAICYKCLSQPFDRSA
jgi:hypothetical protein